MTHSVARAKAAGMKTTLFIALAGLVLGCGGKAADPAAPGDRPAAADGKAAVEKFHDTLAPRWHAERGPKRVADTCGAMAQFRSEADALAAAPAPAGADPAAWTDRGKALVESVAQLNIICKTNDPAAFEVAFEQVHTNFHNVMEAGGSGHHEGEHKGEPSKTEHKQH